MDDEVASTVRADIAHLYLYATGWSKREFCQFEGFQRWDVEFWYAYLQIRLQRFYALEDTAVVLRVIDVANMQEFGWKPIRSR
jgi:hypothetical protein